MTARIVAVFNQKGGAGKTNTTMQIAGTLGRRGLRAAVVDLDPQGTAQRWASMAPESKPFPATVIGLASMGGAMHREVRKFVDHYDVIAIDCPPAIDSPAPQSALLIADLAIIPVIPAPADIWASVAAKQLAARVGTLNETLITRVLINMMTATRLATDLMDVLAEDTTSPMLKTTLGQRSAYRECQLQGCSVGDLPKPGPAKAEINALVDEICGLLRITRSTVTPARKSPSSSQLGEQAAPSTNHQVGVTHVG